MDQYGPAQGQLVEQVLGWFCELDRCDGYLVLLGDPTATPAPVALGPYTDPVALDVADRAAPDGPVYVVRLHHPRIVDPDDQRRAASNA